MYTALILPDKTTFQLSSKTQSEAKREMIRMMRTYPDLGGPPGDDKYVLIRSSRGQVVADFEVKGE